MLGTEVDISTVDLLREIHIMDITSREHACLYVEYGDT